MDIPEAMPETAVVSILVTDISSLHWFEASVKLLGYEISETAIVEMMLVIKIKRAAIVPPVVFMVIPSDSV